MGTYGGPWGPMGPYGGLWRPMGTHGDLWGPMGGPIGIHWNFFFILVGCFSTYRSCFAKVYKSFSITAYKQRSVNKKEAVDSWAPDSLCSP